MTIPGDVRGTIDEIIKFDDAKFGFNHSPTWDAMPTARRGVIAPGAVSSVFFGAHPRVEGCIRALLVLGQEAPVETRRFADFPESGLRQVNDIEWGPNVSVKVRGVCWYIKDQIPVIPLLQPRKTGLSEERLALYASLGRQAFLKGDWHNGMIELVDLSGDEKIVRANTIFEYDLPVLAPDRVALFVSTFVEAKIQVDAIRAARPRKPPKPKGPDLFDPKRPD